VLHGVGQSLQHEEVGGALDRLGVAPPVDLGCHGERGPSGEPGHRRPHGLAQPPVGEHRRVEALGKFAQLGVHRAEPLPDAAQVAVEVLVGAAQLRPGELHLCQQRQHVLLGAVVQVPLDPPPLRVGDRGQPRTRFLEGDQALGLLGMPEQPDQERGGQRGAGRHEERRLRHRPEHLLGPRGGEQAGRHRGGRGDRPPHLHPIGGRSAAVADHEQRETGDRQQRQRGDDAGEPGQRRDVQRIHRARRAQDGRRARTREHGQQHHDGRRRSRPPHHRRHRRPGVPAGRVPGQHVEERHEPQREEQRRHGRQRQLCSRRPDQRRGDGAGQRGEVQDADGEQAGADRVPGPERLGGGTGREEAQRQHGGQDHAGVGGERGRYQQDDGAHPAHPDRPPDPAAHRAHSPAGTAKVDEAVPRKKCGHPQRALRPARFPAEYRRPSVVPVRTDVPGGTAMPDPSPRATPLLLACGALGVAVTTALEVVTAPYSPAVSAYPLNGAVHAAKVVAVVALAAGLAAFAGELRRRGERVGVGAARVLAAATVLGAVPYSVAEALLSPGLDPAAADAALAGTYADHPWIGVVASIALPLVVLSLVTLAVATLRARSLPAWAPVASLAAIPVAALAGVLGGLGWAVPHPPAWLFLGLAAYGFALLRMPAPLPQPA
jgi:hypothetical protein